MYFHIRQHTLKALPLPVIDSFTTEVEALGILGKTIEHEGKFHLLTVDDDVVSSIEVGSHITGYTAQEIKTYLDILSTMTTLKNALLGLEQTALNMCKKNSFLHLDDNDLLTEVTK
jgi:hypothetical protein